MSLITLLDSHLAYGDRPLLDGAQLAVRAGERVGLIGRNGTGKSTLLRVIAGLTQLDDGEVQRRDNQEESCPSAGAGPRSPARFAVPAPAAPYSAVQSWHTEHRIRFWVISA